MIHAQRKRRLFRSSVALALPLLAVAACHPDPKGAGGKGDPPVISLGPENVAKVTQASLQTGPRLTGTLAAKDEAVLRAEADGSVHDVEVEIGDHVEKGQVLARIDAVASQQAVLAAQQGVQSAQSQAGLAKWDVERTEPLVPKGAVAARELEAKRNELAAAQAQVRSAKAQLAAAREQLSHNVVRSPMDGVVGQKAVHEGDVVSPGTLLFRVLDPSSLRLEATVPAEQASTLRVGDPVVFHVRGYGDRTFRGTLERISPAADPSTRQVPLLVSLANPEGKILAGVFAEGRVLSAERTALAVPASAVDRSTEPASVLRIHNGKVERASVILGIEDTAADLVEVQSGLEAGDVVIRGNANTLEPGTHVRVTAPQGPREAAAR